MNDPFRDYLLNIKDFLDQEMVRATSFGINDAELEFLVKCELAIVEAIIENYDYFSHKDENARRELPPSV